MTEHFLFNMQGRPQPAKAEPQTWQYLEAREHAWRRQLYVKGRRLLASIVWGDMIVNHLSKEETAENFDLPLAAIEEIVRYCEENSDLIAEEAVEERRYLEDKGVSIDPSPANR